MENINSNDIDLLNPKAGDVYLVAYPKAGVTWLTEIVTAIYRQYAIEHPNVSDEFASAVRAHAFCDVCPMARRRSTSRSAKKIIGYDANGNEAYETDKTDRRRIVSLHFPAERMERMIPEAFSNNDVKLIYTTRNPKDIAVSYYHFHCMNDALPTPSSWEEFLEDFFSGAVRWGSWADHVRGWWNKFSQHEDDTNASNSRILWLTFEELKKDLPGGIRKVCNHLRLSLSEQGLDTVVRMCTFASMKADPVRNHSGNSLFKGAFLRKGKVGDWKHKFTDEQSGLFDKVLKLQLEEDYARMTGSLTQSILGA